MTVQGAGGAGGPAFNAADALDDPELARLHEERLEELKAMAERRAAKKTQTSYGADTCGPPCMRSSPGRGPPDRGGPAAHLCLPSPIPPGVPGTQER